MIAVSKNTLATLAVITLIQGCSGDGKKFEMSNVIRKAPTEAEYAADVRRMNCTELRSELAKQKRRSGTVMGVFYGKKARPRVAGLESRMRRKGCR